MSGEPHMLIIFCNMALQRIGFAAGVDAPAVPKVRLKYADEKLCDISVMAGPVSYGGDIDRGVMQQVFIRPGGLAKIGAREAMTPWSLRAP